MATVGLEHWRSGKPAVGLPGLAGTLGLEHWRGGSPALFLHAGEAAETITVTAPIVNGPGMRVVPELWLANSGGFLHTDISAQLLDGTVTMNVDQAVKMSCVITVNDPTEIEPYTDYLAPILKITYNDGSDDLEQQAGLFAIKIPPGDYRPETAVAQFTGVDMTSRVFESILDDTYPMASGFRADVYITALIAAAGITHSTIPATGVTLSNTTTRPPGTSRGDLVNDLLQAVGFYTMHADLRGRVVSAGPTQDLASMEPFLTITNDDIYSDSIRVVPSDRQVANIAIVVNENNAAAPLVGTYRNDDPASPSSTVNIGDRVVRDVITGETTQAALNRRARQLVNEGRTYYRTVELSILPTPTALIPHQAVYLDTTGGLADFAGKWWVRQASIGLTPATALTKMTLSQVTRFDGTIV